MGGMIYRCRAEYVVPCPMMFHHPRHEIPTVSLHIRPLRLQVDENVGQKNALRLTVQ